MLKPVQNTLYTIQVLKNLDFLETIDKVDATEEEALSKAAWTLANGIVSGQITPNADQKRKSVNFPTYFIPYFSFNPFQISILTYIKMKKTYAVTDVAVIVSNIESNISCHL